MNMRGNAIVQRGDDIDNRLKTLLAAWSMPLGSLLHQPPTRMA